MRLAPLALLCALLAAPTAYYAQEEAPPAKKKTAEEAVLDEAQLVSTGTKAPARKDTQPKPRLRPTRMLSEVMPKQDGKSLSADLGQRPQDNPSIFIMPGKGDPLSVQGDRDKLHGVYVEAMGGELMTLLAPRGWLVDVEPGNRPLADSPEQSALGRIAEQQAKTRRLPGAIIGVDLVPLRVGTLNGIFGEVTALDPALISQEDDRHLMPDEFREEEVLSAVAHAIACIGRFDAARDYFTMNFLSCRYKYGDGDDRTANARASLARYYRAVGDDAMAAKYAK